MRRRRQFSECSRLAPSRRAHIEATRPASLRASSFRRAIDPFATGAWPMTHHHKGSSRRSEMATL